MPLRWRSGQSFSGSARKPVVFALTYCARFAGVFSSPCCASHPKTASALHSTSTTTIPASRNRCQFWRRFRRPAIAQTSIRRSRVCRAMRCNRLRSGSCSTGWWRRHRVAVGRGSCLRFASRPWRSRRLSCLSCVDGANAPRCQPARNSCAGAAVTRQRPRPLRDAALPCGFQGPPRLRRLAFTRQQPIAGYVFRDETVPLATRPIARHSNLFLRKFDVSMRCLGKQRLQFGGEIVKPLRLRHVAF